MQSLLRVHIHALLLAMFALAINNEYGEGMKLAKGADIELGPLDAWEVVVSNAGVSAMHLAVMSSDKAVIFDRTDYGPSQIRLPDEHCRNDSNDRALKLDCWAHSVELDLFTFSIRPLEILSDTWCSSAAFLSDGTLLQTGGFNDGARVVRHFSPCLQQTTAQWKEHSSLDFQQHIKEYKSRGGSSANIADCDWVELPEPMSLYVNRWYASDQILPDNRVIIVGGRRAFNYEFFPKEETSVSGIPDIINLPFLVETNDLGVENNLYPFLHLSTDGNLFIFANQNAILLNYTSGVVVRRFPTMPGGSRSYPSSGSSVMLPISYVDGYETAEVMVCGGAAQGAFQRANRGEFMEAENTCGRVNLIDPTATWVMEEMPRGRVMGDMLILPTQEILVINGAQNGTAGWQLARVPSLRPYLYRTNTVDSTSKFETQSASSIPRLYHSTAALLPDGKVLVAGSNPNIGYDFGPATDAFFPTELRIETYSPYYLHASYDSLRPTNVSLSDSAFSYNSTNLVVSFNFGLQGCGSGSAENHSLITSSSLHAADLQIVLYSPPFTTHAFSMNQRLLVLQPINVTEASTSTAGVSCFYIVNVRAPPNPTVAPPGYYLLFLVHSHIPSKGSWVHLAA